MLETPSQLLRVSLLIASLVVAAAVALMSTHGQQAWEFAKGARGEIRKIVWPTRRDTVTSTLIVIVMVIIIGLFLWMLDTISFWLIYDMLLNIGGKVVTQDTGSELNTSMKWYVLHTYAGYEKRVQKTLGEHIKRHQCDEKFGKIVVPTEEVMEMRGGRRGQPKETFTRVCVCSNGNDHRNMASCKWHSLCISVYRGGEAYANIRKRGAGYYGQD